MSLKPPATPLEAQTAELLVADLLDRMARLPQTEELNRLSYQLKEFLAKCPEGAIPQSYFAELSPLVQAIADEIASNFRKKLEPVLASLPNNIRTGNT
jgi:hypothetical protein